MSALTGFSAGIFGFISSIMVLLLVSNWARHLALWNGRLIYFAVSVLYGAITILLFENIVSDAFMEGYAPGVGLVMLLMMYPFMVEARKRVFGLRYPNERSRSNPLTIKDMQSADDDTD